LATVAAGIVLQLVVVGRLQYHAAQQQAFERFRKDVNGGVAPLGHTVDGGLVRPGRPVALLSIPSVGVHEVILEGTSSGVLMSGPGHRRDTPLPGQAGTSVVYGRQASYGAPFHGLGGVKVGAVVKVTTQAGISTFRIIDKRRAGSIAPQPVKSGGGRLQLVTAAGISFLPSGVLRVDADLTSKTLPNADSSTPVLTPAEGLMAGDTSTLWMLVLWLQAMVVVAVATVWAWHRWGHVQTWIVLLPLTALMGFWTADQFMKLLPNLL
jgi:LPXTG-site transpeptidase (sortase) family protein